MDDGQKKPKTVPRIFDAELHGRFCTNRQASFPHRPFRAAVACFLYFADFQFRSRGRGVTSLITGGSSGLAMTIIISSSHFVIV